MIEQGIRDLLLANATVKGLLGTRLFPLVLPEELAGAAATYQRISSTDFFTNDGPLGLTKTRLQIDCWCPRSTAGPGYGQVKALEAAIYALLNGYTGTLDDGTVVYETERDDVTDGYDPNSRLYRVQTDWMILHTSS